MPGDYITLRTFLTAFVNDEYARVSSIVHAYNQHIDRLYTEGLIEMNERVQYYSMLNDSIKLMNNIYNMRMVQLNDDTEGINDIKSDGTTMISNDNIVLSGSYSSKNLDDNASIIYGINIQPHNIDQLGNIFNTLRSSNMNHYKGVYLNDFADVIKQLCKLSKFIGFYNVRTALDVLYGPSIGKLLTETHVSDKYRMMANKLAIYDNIFVPLKYNVFYNKQKCITNNMTSEMMTSEHDLIIDNYAKLIIYIRNTSTIITLRGYFIQDPINSIIRTSHVTNKLVHAKLDELYDALMTHDKLKYMNDKFKQVYIKNMSVGEIMSYDIKGFIAKAETDYEKYAKLSKMSFKNLMGEFLLDTQNNLKNMYNIIKTLLIGHSDENSNLAGLLFGLTKDRKFGTGIVADIIHKNLNYMAQCRLKKSNANIKGELDKLKNMTPDDVDLKKQIVANKSMPLFIKRLALDKIEEMKSGSSEYYKQKTFIDILMNYPWIAPDDESDNIFHKLKCDHDGARVFLNNVKTTLDNKVFGHDECKSVMQELIGKWISNPNSMGKAIGLAGPPGVGKTLIAKSLGIALGIPFQQINLGGIEDGCILSGHSYTYSAAQPGLIVRKLVDAGQARCVLFFDELDKSCTKHGINEIYNVLIHATDPNTNTNYNDKFFQEVTFPLNKVLFVFSYNDSKKIDPILLDRMEKIDVKPYSIDDKVKIVNSFLLREVSDSVGFDYGSVEISNDDIEYLIDNYTFEAGVRELKRKLETLYTKLNVDWIYKRNIFEGRESFDNNNRIILTRELIESYINKPQLSIKKIHNTANVGVINGLYATTSGSGGIIPIIIYDNFMSERFALKITGSQGKVMKESLMFAFTTAMSLVKPEYRDKFQKSCKTGLHIHTPDGATPKDGPSAGSAFTTAFISKILNKPIRNDIAITGEIELNGHITQIGGLVFKLKGAQKAGVTTVYIPRENEDDYIKIKQKDPELCKSMNIIIVDHIRQVLESALCETNTDVNIDVDTYMN